MTLCLWQNLIHIYIYIYKQYIYLKNKTVEKISKSRHIFAISNFAASSSSFLLLSLFYFRCLLSLSPRQQSIAIAVPPSRRHFGKFFSICSMNDWQEPPKRSKSATEQVRVSRQVVSLQLPEKPIVASGPSSFVADRKPDSSERIAIHLSLTSDPIISQEK